MHQNNNLVTLKEAANYLRYTYRGFWGRIRKSILSCNQLPAGVYNIAPENSNKQIIRIDLQEFLKGVKKHNVSTKMLVNTYDNCVKGVENSYFLTLSKKTRSGYKRTIALFKSYFSDNEKEVTNITLHTFIDNLRNNHNLADATIKKHLKNLNVIFKFSTKIGSIPKNPLEDFEKNMLKAEERIEYLKPFEVNKINDYLLIDNPNPKNTYLYQQINFALETGLRKEEQAMLSWSNIDFEEREIFIPKTKTKTKRFVPLSPLALKILKDLQEQGFEKPFAKIDFYSWKEILVKLNIRVTKHTSSFRWHDLRHTFGTYCVKGLHTWLDAPMNLQQTAKFMGHSNIKMTTRYAHLDISDVKKLINYQKGGKNVET